MLLRAGRQAKTFTNQLLPILTYLKNSSHKLTVST